MHSFLRFNVNDISAEIINNAKVRFTYASSDQRCDFEVRRVNEYWDEDEITWFNQPAYGATVYGTFYAPDPVSIGQVVEVDIDPSFFNSGDGFYDMAWIAVPGPTGDPSYQSSESPWGQPELIINEPNTTDLVFIPIADVHVRSDQPTMNFYNDTNLRVQYGSRTMRSFLRFNVSGINGETITDIRLRLKEGDGGTGSWAHFEVREVFDSWTETTVTWNDQPSYGTISYGSYTGGVLAEGRDLK
jgi:hypothetical protein